MAATSAPRPQAQVLHNAKNASLADLVPKPTAVNGTTPADATDQLASLQASAVDIGFWTCSAGEFATARHGVNELILVLEGSGTLISEAGERTDHVAGDVVLIPDGWSGTWQIHEQFTKQYITVAI
ncbi:cupin domain-containing protein [Glutamicibacter sp. TV12E]|uniref:cupin domain-containing protein n=1 Tax=Glutamicibacter sp. TV12E TaxID=3446362 RepID=UPI004034AE67